MNGINFFLFNRFSFQFSIQSWRMDKTERVKEREKILLRQAHSLHVH